MLGLIPLCLWLEVSNLDLRVKQQLLAAGFSGWGGWLYIFKPGCLFTNWPLMCLATLSTEAGKQLHAVPLALPHPRGFISLTEQQPLETANQHAVSKGRLRWQLRARAMLSACCHLVIALTAGGTASQLAGRHACQQTLSPPLMHIHMHRGGVLNGVLHPTPALISVWCFSLFLTPPSRLCLPRPPSNSPHPQLLMGWESKNNNKQTAWFFVVVSAGVVVFIQLSLRMRRLHACVLRVDGGCQPAG